MGDKQRNRLIDKQILSNLLNLERKDDLKDYYSNLVKTEVTQHSLLRDTKWTESIAVGGEKYVESVKKRMGIACIHRKIEKTEISYVLKEKERSSAYSHDNSIKISFLSN